jgi:hypothetical protein
MKSMIKEFRHAVLMLMLPLLLLSCDELDNNNDNPPETTEDRNATIGVAGGEIELGSGIKLVIPAGALTADEKVNLSSIDPSDYFPNDEYAFVVRCTSESNSFTKLVEILMPFPTVLLKQDEDHCQGGIFNSATGAFEVLETDVVNRDGVNYLRIQTNHFSEYGGRFF